MPTVVRKTADHAVHSTLYPDTVHHVTLAIPDRPRAAVAAITIVVAHRGGSDDPLFFDFTSATGAAPMTTMLAPGADNTAVLMPGQMIRLDPQHWVDSVSLTSSGIVRYSVWSLW